MPEFNAYHGVSGAQHQQKFTELSQQGFRMISLSVYDSPSDARYAAVWVKRSWTGMGGRTWCRCGRIPECLQHLDGQGLYPPA